MGAFASLNTGGRIVVWVISGFAAGVSLSNWIQLNSVISYETENDVQARIGATSNSTMRNVNRGAFWIFFIIFLIASYYLFFPSKHAAKAEKALSQPRSLPSAILA